MVITAFIDEARARKELINLMCSGSITCISCGRELDINMEVKDIAAELNLTVDTVKLWKFKYENM